MARNNLPLGMQFRTCENFGESTDSSLVLSPKFSQIQKPHRKSFDCDSQRESTTNQAQSCNSPSLRDSVQGAESWQSTDSKNSPSLAEGVRGWVNFTQGVDSADSQNLGENQTKFAESTLDSADSAPSAQKNDKFADSTTLPKNTKIRSIIVGASGLSLGISIVVAIMLGVGAGILMQKIFKVAWVLFLGVFWGIAAAVLNVYKVYKAELRDFEKLANDPKYKY